MLKGEYSDVISEEYNKEFNNIVLTYTNFEQNTSKTSVDNEVFKNFFNDGWLLSSLINRRYRTYFLNKSNALYSAPIMFSKEAYLYLAKTNDVSYDVLYKWFNNKRTPLLKTSGKFEHVKFCNTIEESILYTKILDWCEEANNNMDELINEFVNDVELQILLIKFLVYNIKALYSTHNNNGTMFFMYYVSYLIAKKLEFTTLTTYVVQTLENDNFYNTYFLKIDVHFIKLLCERINDNTLYETYMKKLNNKPIDILTNIINILDNENTFPHDAIAYITDDVIVMLNYFMLQGNTSQINKFLLSNDIVNMFEIDHITHTTLIPFYISTYVYKKLTQIYTSDEQRDKLFHYIIGNKSVNKNIETCYHFVMYEWPNMLDYLSTNNYNHTTVTDKISYDILSMRLEKFYDLRNHTNLYLLRFVDVDITNYINDHKHH